MFLVGIIGHLFSTKTSRGNCDTIAESRECFQKLIMARVWKFLELTNAFSNPWQILMERLKVTTNTLIICFIRKNLVKNT